ncbi:GntR family transcriptional regulator [Mycobacterium sp. 852002-51057_SCH5723018]|uniref:GntR family transcriptional regulator n=1 Tax=Mycobacterium sp. 852002-51057_SCH5723018 TaxID=1834094 RepID=UPI0007FE79D3|nr:GntR family transcriptional regulator [Mycobacterium sp. 852002-51057_SCH5723018]OBG19284.1 GntR family transcriptional regulator [Mycobacterium sp. 852002-51057_SCH5723018]
MSVTGHSPSDNALGALPAALSLAERGSTPRLIANALRAAIVDGTLAPGTPLRQDAIARHFAVSAIPVREALRQLESEGWAKVEMNKGATVAPLSAGEAREIYEIRAALESLAIARAIPAHTPESLRHAEALCKAASAETEPSLYVARNEAFHQSLYEPAARPQLLAMIGMLHERGERYLRLKLGLPSYKRESDREHMALLKAVRRGDVATAQALVTKHLLDTGDLIHRFLAEDAQA